MNISICRKIFATFLRSEGVEQEMIDLLQGQFLNLFSLDIITDLTCQNLKR